MTSAPSLPFQPQGYLSVAKNIGIKDDTLDFTVIHSTARAAAVGMFTQSLFCGAPIIVGREHLVMTTRIRWSSTARTPTSLPASAAWTMLGQLPMGGRGIGYCPRRRHSELDGRLLAITCRWTGSSKPLWGKLRDEMCPHGLDLAAEAIMTTDTRPKRIAKRVGGGGAGWHCQGRGDD